MVPETPGMWGQVWEGLKKGDISRVGHGGTPMPEARPGIGGELAKGLTQSSVPGMMQRQQLPDEPTARNVWERTSHSVGTMLGDAPYYIAGAFAGGTPGAIALTQGIRKAYIDHLEQGDIESLGEFGKRAAGATWATAKGALTGKAFDIGGVIGGTVVGAGLERRLPTAQEFIDNAILITGFKATGLAIK